jgi:hypothetical protein
VNWEAISAIGQIVGALAVVISLIYLAREIRSNARATRRAAMRSLLEAFNRLTQQLSSHSDPRVWRGLEAVMRDLNACPGVQAWWRSYSRYFGGEEFAKFINQQQQAATRHHD